MTSSLPGIAGWLQGLCLRCLDLRGGHALSSTQQNCNAWTCKQMAYNTVCVQCMHKVFTHSYSHTRSCHIFQDPWWVYLCTTGEGGGGGWDNYFHWSAYWYACKYTLPMLWESNSMKVTHDNKLLHISKLWQSELGSVGNGAGIFTLLFEVLIPERAGVTDGLTWPSHKPSPGQDDTEFPLRRSKLGSD